MAQNTSITAPHDGHGTDIGLEPDALARVADGLSDVLADTYFLYLKTHDHHWNVTGPRFDTLHSMFEEQYRSLWSAVDEVAERIRTLGHAAPGTYRLLSDRTTIPERDAVPSAEGMLQDLLQGHESAIRTCRSALDAAQAADDEGTVDLLVGRLREHEKTAWMLRSMLG